MIAMVWTVITGFCCNQIDSEDSDQECEGKDVIEIENQSTRDTNEEVW